MKLQNFLILILLIVTALCVVELRDLNQQTKALRTQDAQTAEMFKNVNANMPALVDQMMVKSLGEFETGLNYVYKMKRRTQKQINKRVAAHAEQKTPAH